MCSMAKVKYSESHDHHHYASLHICFAVMNNSNTIQQTHRDVKPKKCLGLTKALTLAPSRFVIIACRPTHPSFSHRRFSFIRSPLPDGGTLCCTTSRRRRHWLFLGNASRLISSIVPSTNSRQEPYFGHYNRSDLSALLTYNKKWSKIGCEENSAICTQKVIVYVQRLIDKCSTVDIGRSEGEMGPLVRRPSGRRNQILK